VTIRLHWIHSIQALLDKKRRIQIELGKQQRRKNWVGRDCRARRGCSVPQTSFLLRCASSLDANPQDQWPDNVSCLPGITPRGAKLIDYLFQRIVAFRGDEPLRGRPRSKIAEQMIEIPLRCHFELRRIELVKRERQIGELFNKLALRRPETPDHLVVVSIHHLIDRRFDVQQVVSRRSEHAIISQHASRFAVKAVQIEPVQCLRNHDQINRL